VCGFCAALGSDLIAAVLWNWPSIQNLIGVGGYRLQSMGALTRARAVPISTLDELVRSAVAVRFCRRHAIRCLQCPGSELPSAHARAHTKARTHHNYSVPPYSCAPLLRCRDVAWRGVVWPDFGVYRCGQSLSMQTVGGLAVRCR